MSIEMSLGLATMGIFFSAYGARIFRACRTFLRRESDCFRKRGVEVVFLQDVTLNPQASRTVKRLCDFGVVVVAGDIHDEND
jgi:hypothetical protein